MISMDLLETKNDNDKSNAFFIDIYERCPICGQKLIYQEITRDNPGAMTWCTNPLCDYRYNQFLSYKDFKLFSE